MEGIKGPQRAGREIEDTSHARLQASAEGLRLFRESPFGLSAHWGLYSLSIRDTEWIYYSERIPLEEYRARVDAFDPVRFNAEEWADLMLEAGQKFLIITSKHHDGFCLFNSQYTDFTIANTPFRRDVLAELARALADRGLGLHFYYSLVDWTHPAYRTDWPKYVEYYQNQIRELCTNYGKVAGIVFDGYWPGTGGDFFRRDPAAADYFAARGPWDLAGTYDIIHELQPDAVVGNNSHEPPTRGEDYQVWELDLPGENTIGWNTTEIGDKPTACWWNLNAGWSYQPWNHAVKSAESIVETYRAVRGHDAAFFLNVGPRPFGDIHPEEQAVLRQIGAALRREGQ